MQIFRWNTSSEAIWYKITSVSSCKYPLRLCISSSAEFPSVEMENLCEGQRWSLASRLSGVIMVKQTLKNLPAMQEAQVPSLGREDPLEKEMATHSSILSWRIPWTEEPDRLQSMGSPRVGHDWATNTSLHFMCIKGLIYTFKNCCLQYSQIQHGNCFDIQKHPARDMILFF